MILNSDLTNFWLVLRTESLFNAFIRYVRLTPFSEEVFKACRDSAYSANKVDRAYTFFIRYRQSRQGLGRDFATLSRNRTRRDMNEQVSAWLSAVDGLPDAHERLKRVAVLNRPAIDVIRSQDGAKTMFYLDPPYLHETRSTTSEYGANEMCEEQHRELLDSLSGLQGKFILSGYPSNLYAGYAADNKWARKDFEIDNKASGSKVKERKVECLWMNF